MWVRTESHTKWEIVAGNTYLAMKTLKIIIEAKSARSDCCTILHEMTGPVINLPRDDAMY
jgi:hypothetical protein